MKPLAFLGKMWQYWAVFASGRASTHLLGVYDRIWFSRGPANFLNVIAKNMP
jgi:hypothetical protein